jgi:hypothetical protein
MPEKGIFSEKISTRVRVRPFEAALAAAREIKAHAPHCRVVFTVYEMKRLGPDAAELTAREAAVRLRRARWLRGRLHRVCLQGPAAAPMDPVCPCFSVFL